jgi:hypothetical protein
MPFDALAWLPLKPVVALVILVLLHGLVTLHGGPGQNHRPDV